MTTKRTRQELRNLFKQGAMPSGTDFSDLIESSLNVVDDSVEKPVGSDQPLKIKVQGEMENILDIYSAQNEPTIRLNQVSENKIPGFNLNMPQGVSRLFIESSSGNIGISTDTPKAKLHVLQNEKGDSLRIDDEVNDITPLVVNSEGKVGIGIAKPKAQLDVKGDLHLSGATNLDGAVAMKNSLTISGKTTTQNDLEVSKNLAVKGQTTLGGTVNVKRTLAVTGSTSLAGALEVKGKTTLTNELSVTNTLIANKSSVMLGGFSANDADEWPKIAWCRDIAKKWDEGLIKHSSKRGMFKKAGFGIHMHESREWGIFSTNWDSLFGIEGKSGNTKIKGTLTVSGAITPSAGEKPGNGIMFPKNPFGGGGDAAWIRYYTRSGEATTLEIGTANDKNDHLALMSSGFVGIGTNAPEAALSIANKRGKQNYPNSDMHITADCILFGGKNAGKQADSAQISAGKHRAGSLNIVGMSADTNAAKRKIEMWAEGGVTINGTILKFGNWIVSVDKNNMYFKCGSKTIARLSNTHDRFLVFKNIDGKKPYFYFNSHGNFGRWP